MAEAKHFLSTQNILGEGPVWNSEKQALYWVDIKGKTINRYFPSVKKLETFFVGAQVGAFAFREKGGLVVAADNGFSFWDEKANTLSFINDPEEGKEEARFNDGKVDRQGRFWAGTMTTEGATSSLYRLDADLQVHPMESEITISNGIGWSLDNKIMYFADSMRYVIYAYDFDSNRGVISNKRTFVQLSKEDGVPDGLTVDSAGCVWCALYDGWKVVRFDPSGKAVLRVDVPVANPTSCIFGGEEMDELYITSAWDELSFEERGKQPMAGDLFVYKAGVKGLPEPKFAG